MTRDFQQWASRLEAAALKMLGPRRHGPDRDSYRVYALACPEHGPSCARVVYGVLMDHFGWQNEDPQRLAEKLVRTLLPPASAEQTPQGPSD
jgi:hypothetical protein